MLLATTIVMLVEQEKESPLAPVRNVNLLLNYTCVTRYCQVDARPLSPRPGVSKASIWVNAGRA